MVKAQLRRDKHGPHYNQDRVDDGFVRGSYKDAPKFNECFRFFLGNLDAGWWTTSPVTDIIKNGRVTTVVTANSTYTLIKGWGTP